MVTEPFREPARLNAEAMGVPRLHLLVLPHPVGDLPDEEVRKMAAKAYPMIVKALAGSPQAELVQVVDYELP